MTVDVFVCRACVPSCSNSTYQEGSLCRECHESCQTCSGPTLVQCLSCHPGIKFHPKHNTCAEDCMVGTYNGKPGCRARCGRFFFFFSVVFPPFLFCFLLFSPSCSLCSSCAPNCYSVPAVHLITTVCITGVGLRERVCMKEAGE